MKNYDENSYDRYKQYRIDKYSYEQEQIVFPIGILLIGTAIISLWKYILIAAVVACIIAVLCIVVYFHKKKQIFAAQAIELTQEDAKEGVSARINITYKSSKATLDFDIPPDVKNGQKFVVKNVLFEDCQGKKVKKSVHLKVNVS